MVLYKLLTVFVLAAALCNAAPIDIITMSGTIKDESGKGISGAVVYLEMWKISTATKADGRFTLTNMPSRIQMPDRKSSQPSLGAIKLDNDILRISVAKQTAVTIKIYDCNGRLLVSDKKMVISGNHAFVLPQFHEGLRVCTVTLNNDTYIFRGASIGIGADKAAFVRSTDQTLSKQTAGFLIKDVLGAGKEGYLKYRVAVQNPDTSGIIITMLPSAGNVTDADGNIYQTVRLGDQVWTTENLKTTKYNDGTPIKLVADSTAWSTCRTPAFCYPKNDSQMGKYHGVLYNWFTVNTGKLAPAGWKVPTEAEWDILQNYLIINGYNWNGKKTNNQIAKAMAAKVDWVRSYISYAGCVGNDLSANNRSGFSALPSENRSENGKFGAYGGACTWWTATMVSSSDASCRYLTYTGESLEHDIQINQRGHSVRLVKSN